MSQSLAAIPSMGELLSHALSPRGWLRYPSEARPTRNDALSDQALVDAILEAGPAKKENLFEKCAFIWGHMVSEGMVRLVHYLDMEYVLKEMQPFLSKYRAELMWTDHVDCSDDMPKPFKPDVDAAPEVLVADPNVRI